MVLKRYIVAGNFIDGSGAAMRRNVFLTVEDSIITAIRPAEELPRDDKAAIDDFSHCTIVPALVDCSVSLSRSPSVDSSVRLSAENADFEHKVSMMERHIGYCHAYGVLGVADSDAITNLAKKCRNKMVMETIFNLSITGRDFLKVYYSANIEDKQVSPSQLAPENLSRSLQHKGEKRTVVVANGPQQVADAIEAGCDAIEQGYGMGEDNLRKMADKGVLWIPCLLRAKTALDGAGSGDEIGCRFSTRYVVPGKSDPGAEAYWQKMLAEQLAQLSLARKLGVQTVVGTGAGSVGILHGESMVEEMKLFIKAGYPLIETIQCASDNGARFFDMEKLGTLTIGNNATFLITRGTVQQLPRKLSYLESIYVDGAPTQPNI